MIGIISHLIHKIFVENIRCKMFIFKHYILFILICKQRKFLNSLTPVTWISIRTTIVLFLYSVNIIQYSSQHSLISTLHTSYLAPNWLLINQTPISQHQYDNLYPIYNRKWLINWTGTCTYWLQLITTHRWLSQHFRISL